ncbi:MAG TPA: hypothetical protein VK772_03960 [Puia sp.]|jgi:hypothetical protein|nr:hypothetical protein [Puia sp.]
MEYQIIEDLKYNYTVFYQGKKFIKIIQKTVWLIGNRSQFYIDNVLVLETVTYSFFLWQKMEIQRCDQERKFDLFRKGLNYGLRNNEGDFTLSIGLFRRTMGKLYLNGVQIGEIKVSKTISADPWEFDVHFYQDNANYYFAIILFVMHLQIGL